MRDVVVSPAEPERPRAILAAVATRAQVERTLDDLIGRLHDADVSERSLPAERTLLCHISDLALWYRGTFSEGRISGLVAVKKPPRGDVVITVSSDDLVALSEGRLSPVFAFLSGKLRVDAGARDLMLIRQLF
jgi:predicted lipid carrier protein YhbT